MSYSRDPDRHTRGAGAIAARDNAHPGAAHARQRLRNQQTVAHDRAVRQMTLGPRGGLGRIDLGRKTAPTQTGTGIHFDYGTSAQPTIPTAPGGGGVIATPTKSVFKTPGAVKVTMQQEFGVIQPPPSSQPPPPLPPPVMPETTTGQTLPGKRPPVLTGGVTGGSGSGGIVPPRPRENLPELDEVVLPDVPAATASSMPSGKTLAIVGAAALAAYFLLRKKGGG